MQSEQETYGHPLVGTGNKTNGDIDFFFLPPHLVLQNGRGNAHGAKLNRNLLYLLPRNTLMVAMTMMMLLVITPVEKKLEDALLNC